MESSNKEKHDTIVVIKETPDKTKKRPEEKEKERGKITLIICCKR